ncbi:hypothetical protein LEN26_016883 [Aphanomyces euteiches]|nr:hypothetical protein LEN26_016883 [Aphanomyces euteiches]KAH9104484.1 hypothetical protein AeMF1_019460 [Aphanomyces euteiches]KAH9187131.1 hypothetical protein AeNC1_010884 [Aphanomyces euteiches]
MRRLGIPQYSWNPARKMVDLTAFTTYPNNRVVLARLGVLVTTIISFFCSTKVTGPSYGDYCFLVSFIAIAYTLLHSYYVTYSNAVSVVHLHQLVTDGILAVLLLAGGIALAASNWASWGLPAAGTVTIVFLFIATFFQIAVVVLLYISAAPAAGHVTETPANDYVTVNTPVSDEPVVKTVDQTA